MKTKLEIIQETVEAYTDANNRGTSSWGYEYVTEDGRKCAAGRCMVAPELYCGSIDSLALKNHGSNVPFSDELFLPEYRGHSREFWQDIQSLHDSDINFVDGTWSELGKLRIEALKKC